MQTTKCPEFVQESEAEAAAHQWQVRKMAEWLAKPIGPKVTPGDDVHRILCAIQVMREQVPAYTVSQLARKSGIPRSSLHDKLNANSVLTVTDVFRVAEAMEVTGVDIMELSAKGQRSTPPAGYALAEGCSDRWIGPETVVGEVTVIPTWNARDEHLLELWTAKDTADASMVELSPAGAYGLAGVLIGAPAIAKTAGSAE